MGKAVVSNYTTLSGCNMCPMGFYSTSGSISCTPCPYNTYASTQGSSYCSPCSNPTSYTSTNPTTSPSNSNNAGYYTSAVCTSITDTLLSPCTSPIQSNQFVSSICSFGNSTSLGVNSIVQTCASSSNGYTLSSSCIQGSITVKGMNSAFVCSEGYYGFPVVSNYTSLSGCVSCKMGTYSSNINQTLCTTCPAGSYCITGASTPILCPSGS